MRGLLTVKYTFRCELVVTCCLLAFPQQGAYQDESWTVQDRLRCLMCYLWKGKKLVQKVM